MSIIAIDMADQDPSIPEIPPTECVEKRSDCPGERGWEGGYGMAGGGMGCYTYCPLCGQVISKTQDPSE